ncbi:2OG-Fe(II) oxygenase family protein [Streptomyces rochei]|uniref:2OG-Fe(II) oxygenase family protein n=1 Tax=Streptomyces rochei TaxID=1928 RepID=UPI0036D1A49F
MVDHEAPDAAYRFQRCLAEVGYAVLVNHPIPASMIQSIYDEWLAFFDTDAKHRYTAGGECPDGYFPPPPASDEGTSVTRDRKEFFHLYPSGRYPSEVSDTARQYFYAARTLATTLLSRLDEAAPAEVTRRLSMPLERMADNSAATVLRIQRYLPSAEQEVIGGTRALAHTDINLLTVLPAASGPGLQVRTPDGWTDVEAEAGSLVIQAGEMLALASGGHYPAALHRVVSPRDRPARESRMSVPLFLHPADEVPLTLRVSAADFRAKRLAELSEQGWNAVTGGARSK